jgi:hypothetical protein
MCGGLSSNPQHHEEVPANRWGGSWILSRVAQGRDGAGYYHGWLRAATELSTITGGSGP